jgi:hypothetical protein
MKPDARLETKEGSNETNGSKRKEDVNEPIEPDVRVEKGRK